MEPNFLTGEMQVTQSLRKKIRKFLLEILLNRTDSVEVDTPTRILKFVHKLNFTFHSTSSVL